MKTKFNAEQKNQLKLHGAANITYILDKLGISYTERGPLIQACCPTKDHPGDGNNPTAFCWNEEMQIWKCFTHGCEELYGQDIIGLVRSILCVSFQDALEWIYDILTNKEINLNTKVSVKKDIQLHIHRPLQEQYIKFLNPNQPHPYLLKRGLDPQILSKIEIGFWHRIGSFMNDRVIVPIRDINDHLVGFSGRTIHPENLWEKLGIQSKWIHGRYYDRWSHPGEFSKSSILYNLNNAKQLVCQKSRTHDKILYIVEGPFDGLQLEQANIHNWIALLGHSMSIMQRTSLIKCGVHKINLALDPDKAGQEASLKIKFQLQEFFNVDIMDLQKEPGDMNQEDIKRIFQCN